MADLIQTPSEKTTITSELNGDEPITPLISLLLRLPLLLMAPEARVISASMGNQHEKNDNNAIGYLKKRSFLFVSMNFYGAGMLHSAPAQVWRVFQSFLPTKNF